MTLHASFRIANIKMGRGREGPDVRKCVQSPSKSREGLESSYLDPSGALPVASLSDRWLEISFHPVKWLEVRHCLQP